MIAFWLIAAAMICAALAVVLPPLLRRADGARDVAERTREDATEATIRVYRERLAELRREYDLGHLTAEDYAVAEGEAKRELLAYVSDKDEASASARGRPAIAGVVCALAVPAVALSIYAASGRPDLLAADHADRLDPEQVARYARMAPANRIPLLEAHVAEHRAAPRAWSLLGAAYRAEERYRAAAEAFRQARATGATEDASLIARQAESLLLASGRRFTPEVQRLIKEALRVDPRNPLGLMLAGHSALVRGDPARAAEHWQRLAEQIPESDPRRRLVDGLIARAQGEPVEGGPASATARASTATAAGTGATIAVRLRLSEPLRGQADASDTVFVFARAAGAPNGPPLAVQRTTVGALPARIELSDAQAMMPGRNLSSAERVVVTARVSRSGDVAAGSGDLQGRSEPVATDHAEPLELTIDQRIE